MYYDKLCHNHRAFLSLSIIAMAKTLSVALGGDENWRNAMKVEMDVPEKYKIWELVKLLKGKKPIGCK